MEEEEGENKEEGAGNCCRMLPEVAASAVAVARRTAGTVSAVGGCSARLHRLGVRYDGITRTISAVAQRLTTVSLAIFEVDPRPANVSPIRRGRVGGRGPCPRPPGFQPPWGGDLELGGEDGLTLGGGCGREVVRLHGIAYTHTFGCLVLTTAWLAPSCSLFLHAYMVALL